MTDKPEGYFFHSLKKEKQLANNVKKLSQLHGLLHKYFLTFETSVNLEVF